MSRKRLIKLAENPEEDFDFEEEEDMFGDEDYDDEDDMFEDDDEMMEEDEDDFGDDSDLEDEMEESAYKGKRVSGPRTKLASRDEIADIRRSVGQLAKSVNALAQVQKAMLEKGMDMMDEDDDPMALEGEDEDKVDLAKSRTSKARISKDDAASSFGEKDSNVPGNRPYDQTNPGEEDTVINSGPAAGPGPVSKGQMDPRRLQSMVNRAVREALAANGVSAINKSTAPAVRASSKIEKGVNSEDLAQQLKGRSFKEINTLRVQMGDLPSGIL